MGRERSGARQLVYFCLAQVILLLTLAGCSLFRVGPEDEPARQALTRAKRLLSQENYDGAARENQRAMTLANNKPPADEALFYLGVINANTANPKRDNCLATAYFNRVIREYPQSPWV